MSAQDAFSRALAYVDARALTLYAVYNEGLGTWWIVEDTAIAFLAERLQADSQYRLDFGTWLSQYGVEIKVAWWTPDHQCARRIWNDAGDDYIIENGPLTADEFGRYFGRIEQVTVDLRTGKEVIYNTAPVATTTSHGPVAIAHPVPAPTQSPPHLILDGFAYALRFPQCPEEMSCVEVQPNGEINWDEAAGVDFTRSDEEQIPVLIQIRNVLRARQQKGIPANH